MADYKQQDYYDIDAIEARLNNALGSDAWANVKKTDLGQNLIKFAANAIHMDAMAFFIGLNQMFKSTVTMAGYAEELAKSKGVIPRTYISASVSVTISAKSGSRTFQPLNLSIRVGGYNFYNIQDLTIDTTPQTIVLYEGGVVREATVNGKPTGSAWSYNKMKAVQNILVGDSIIRKYILLPRDVYVDSIMVESGITFATPFTRWSKVTTWYDSATNDRVWKLEKDVLGRYKVEFGDGVYGKVFPTDEIVGIRYLLSKGAGVVIDDYSGFKLYNQSANDLTSEYNIAISTVVDGQSEVNIEDLKLEIERAENTRSYLITDSDYVNYLESRYDVLHASVQTERKNNPPNIDYFNTVTYIIKPNTEGSNFNDSEIQAHLNKYGMKTIEFRYAVPRKARFRLTVDFAVLPGYSDAGVSETIITLLENEFSWNNLGFDEMISRERVYSVIKDIQGLDASALTIRTEHVHTNYSTGAIISLFNAGEVDLVFYPMRFRMYFQVTGQDVKSKDNGKGALYADKPGTEKFNFVNDDNLCRNTFAFGNMMFLGANGTIVRLLDLRKTTGGVSNIQIINVLVASCWCDRYNNILTIENNTGTYYLRAYAFPADFIDTEGYNYVQLSSTLVYTVADKQLTLTPPSGCTTPALVTYFDSYVYVVWNVTTGNKRLYRYRIMSESISAFDVTYNGGSGYLALNDRTYTSMVMVEVGVSSIVLLILGSNYSGVHSGIDVVVEADIAEDCVFESNFFTTDLTAALTGDLSWKGLSTDGVNVYALVDSTTFDTPSLVKLYALSELGTLSVKTLYEDSTVEMYSCAYNSYNAKSEVYAYSGVATKVFVLDYDLTLQNPTQRAGSTSGSVTSITKILDIDYANMKVTFPNGALGVLSYEPEGNLNYTGDLLPILDDLTVE